MDHQRNPGLEPRYRHAEEACKLAVAQGCFSYSCYPWLSKQQVVCLCWNSNVPVQLGNLQIERREIVWFWCGRLLRAVYFLVKHRIPHTTVFPNLLELLVENGDGVLGRHLNECPGNAQYTSKFSVNKLIEALDMWLDNKLIRSLKSSPYFSILSDELMPRHLLSGRAIDLL